MSGRDTVRAGRLPDATMVEVLPDGATRPLTSGTDWRRLEAMTEEEIEANAVTDPDNSPLTADELARMRPVPDPKAIRRRLRLTPEQFAARFGVALGTLRNWEQGGRTPDSTARTLPRVIDKNPEAVIDALG